MVPLDAYFMHAFHKDIRELPIKFQLTYSCISLLVEAKER